MVENNKATQNFGCFESELLHLHEEIETFQAEMDATIGQLRETLRAFRDVKKPDSGITRCKSERTRGGRKRN